MVPVVNINYLAVLVAAVAAHILGFLWYGPLFGKQWMAMMGMDKKKMQEAKKKGMGAQTWIVMIVGTLLTSFVLAHFVKYLNAETIADALELAFWTWLRFFGAVMLGTVIWEGRPWKLYFLNTAYWLVNLCIMASILTLWS